MFEWLESSAIAVWVGESLYGYPFMLALHAVGLSIVVGIFAMRDLRLLGCFPGIRYAAIDSVRKLAWSGFVVNAVSGCFLFSSQATYFIESTPFLSKIALIFLAAICAAILQNRLREEAPEWDESGAIAMRSVRVFAIVSLLLWSGAIVAGRLVAYL